MDQMEQTQNQNSNEQESSQEEIPAAVRDFVTKTVNAANSSHGTRLQRAIDKKIQEKLAENNPALVAQLKELLGITEQSGEGNSHVPAATDEQNKFRAQLAQMQKEVQEAKARAEQKEVEIRRSEEVARLTDALRAANVSEERIRGAKALLYTEDKRIGRDANGQIVFKIQRDGYEDEVSLSEGIAWWSQTDEGKHYIAPRQVSGSGATGGNAPRRNQQMSDTEKKQLAANVLMKRFFNGE